MNLKELKYIISGEDRLSNKLRRVNTTSRTTNRRLSTTSKHLKTLRSDMSSLSTQIPGLNVGLSILSNPITLLGGVAVGLAVGLNKASIEAARFNSEFRELQNLNIDKTAAQLDSLKQDVFDTAFRKGFDAIQTGKGFYDIQSITGKYGDEVERIVSKQGEFAKLARADFNTYIESTGKAMANYGFGADQLDRFNRSAYATVKVGSVTYDQLAKVQSVYAGYAAAAKQSFDSGNKLFTLFTVKTKNADEAATLTKSAFTDLFKPEVIKTFERAGVKMFDTVTGEARQVDQIMLDLNKKFMSLGTDQEINNLRNQFKGSEGLVSLIQAAADKSGQLKTTLEGFDNTKLGLDTMMANAKTDLDYINDQLNNRTKTLMAEIGQNMLPVKIAWKEFLNETLEDTKIMTSDNGVGFWDMLFRTSDYQEVRTQKYRDKHYQTVMDKYAGDLASASTMTKDVFESKQRGFIFSYQFYKDLSSKSSKFSADYNFAKGNMDAYYKLLQEFPERRSNPENFVDDTYLTNENPTPDADVTEKLNTISGGGTQQKNITVNIQSLINDQNINVTNLTEAEPEIEAKIVETIIRAVTGAEQIMN